MRERKEMNNNFVLESRLKVLNLHFIKESYLKVAEQIQQDQLGPIDYLKELLKIELEQRDQKNIINLLKLAKLPRDKLLLDFDIKRIPTLHPGVVKSLSEGGFIDRCENILIFGNPGTGKSHLSIALAREWCLQGRKCLYLTAANLSQQLVVAKNQQKLTQLIKRLDKFEVLIIDDISYVPYDKHETDLLFILLAERYEQRSTVISSNLVFSKWNQIFKDEMTTAAAIDRLVHHSTILELNTESYRMATAKNKKSLELILDSKKAVVINSKKEDKSMVG